MGGSNPYWYVAGEFTATATSQVLKIVNDATGDHTLVIDDFKIAPSTRKWTVAAWSGDLDSGVDSTFLYTHAYNFGSGSSVDINGVTFTGVPGISPAVAGRFSTTYLGNTTTDAFTTVGDNSATLAAAFVYGGNVPAGLYQSITMQGLTPGIEYITTLYSVAWENPAVGSRWAIFSMGEDRITVNQDQFFDNGGITISYRYTADASGAATLKFAPFAPANVSFHVYAFCNREAVSRLVAPFVTAQPASQIVSPEVPTSFTVAASGVPTPTYQWRFNGAPITDATAATYTIDSVLAANAGTYDVILSNRVGMATSHVARLTVGLPIVNPSFEVDIFGTFPGYVSGNFPITGWDALGGHGLNPANGSPFADNGVIPSGAQVAFMQAIGTMSQSLSGFTVGNQYYVHYYENGRTGPTAAGVEVQVGGATVVPAHKVVAVGGGKPYYEMYSSVFTATSATLSLAFIKSSPEGGDCTALIDNVAIIPVPRGHQALRRPATPRRDHLCGRSRFVLGPRPGQPPAHLPVAPQHGGHPQRHQYHLFHHKRPVAG